MDFDAILRWLHVIAGVLTLGSMGIPLLTRKGGRIHRQAGWVFVVCMAFLSLSSMWLCVCAMLGFQGESVTGRGVMSAEFGAFLFVISLLTGHSVFCGIRVLKQKRRTSPLRNPLDWAFDLSLGLGSVGLLVWGISTGSVLLIGFGVLGTLSAWRHIRLMQSVPTDKQYWWYTHMSAMIGGCIGALSAFLVINSEQFPTAVQAAVPAWVFWLAPTILGVPVLIRWRAHYRRKFSAAATAAKP